MSIQSYPLKDKRVFVVEDKGNNRAVMESVLRPLVHEIGFDDWGVNSLEKLKEFGDVDLILLDLRLPNNTSGFDVYEQIRSDPDYADTPVIAVSASEPDTVLPRLRSSGFSGLISKPIDILKFPLHIARVMKAEKFTHIEYSIHRF